MQIQSCHTHITLTHVTVTHWYVYDHIDTSVHTLNAMRQNVSLSHEQRQQQGANKVIQHRRVAEAFYTLITLC